MRKELSSKRQRLIANALLVGVISIAIGLSVVPIWMANRSYANELDHLHKQLQTYHRVSARDADLLPRFEQLKRSQLSNGHFLRSETAAVAGAELQRLVKDIAAGNQAQVLSTQILPTAREQDFIQITLKVRLRGSLQGVLQSFHAMETNNIFLFLEDVSMRESTAGRRPRQVSVKQMDADFNLVAYMADIS